MTHNVPSTLTSREWLPPPATATTLLFTHTGRLLLLVVPLPNWPAALLPIAQSVPSFFTNSEWL